VCSPPSDLHRYLVPDRDLLPPRPGEDLQHSHHTALDSRGATTVVGFDHNVVLADRLPAAPRGVLLARSSGEEAATAKNLHFTLVVFAPDGEVVFARNGRAPAIRPRLLPGLPPRINVAMDFQFTVTAHGEHTFRMSVRSEEGGEDGAQTPLWVVNPKPGRERSAS